MKRMPFECPTEHYDERISSIDEKLCELIKQRKEMSNNNPGFPPFEYIAAWAKKFEIYEDLIKSVFASLWNEKQFRPIIEPDEFRKHLLALKSVEKDNRIFSVTFIRQYNNSSVVNFNIDWDATNDSPEERPHYTYFELISGQQYDCRMLTMGGSTGHISYNFIVTPPLPDNISGIDLVFREFQSPGRNKPTGLEVTMHFEG